ncbi:DUF4189 domain-containing protein [Nocardia uniformis]|uniref:DUF4189 domain-containing protein n=2 Tax=Nocardia uniformis TaxID=53432 RepID=A0A849CEL4_9NOCA|nr:DUF4189 domain-containing protein [Nocardia uniformis]
MTTNAAYNHKTKAAAVTAALNKCRGGCAVQVTFTSCGAVAYSRSAKVYTGGAAATRTQAEKKARKYSDSRIVESICNS